MTPRTPFLRFLLGLILLLIVVIPGFLWIVSAIPNWGARPDEISRGLPGDEIIPQPQYAWNHAITIHAAPEEIYPWLVQIGDTRGAFYSYSFIENLFMMSGNLNGRYVNAGRVHPEWQNPPKGQGMIVNYLAIQDYKPGEYVLASATPEIPFHWTWLWYLQPVDQHTTRLIVRHRFVYPANMPKSLITGVLNTGFVMERGMMLGIRDRAEGRVPPAFEEPVGIFLWLVALVCGLIAAARFIRQPQPVRFHPLGIGLEAVLFLFLFTYIQPALWLRALLDLLLIASVVIAYQPGRVSRLLKLKPA